MTVRVVLYGSRPDGHARVVFEVLLANTDLEVTGLVDDEPENAHRRIGQLSVVGTRRDLAALREDGLEGVVLGFGGAAGRAAAVAAVRAAGLALPTLVHPSAHVSTSATLGPGAQVLPLASVGPGATIGSGAIVNTGAIIEHDVSIADYSVIGPGAVLAGRAAVREGGEIGARAVVLPDVVVGDRAVLGAGAVLTATARPGLIYVGIPAREISSAGGE